MRALLALVIIILVAAGISPFIAGYYYKKNYYDFINKLNAKNPTYQVSIEQYKQGWFTSDSISKIIPSGNASQKYTITINNHITHGPLILTPHPQFAMAKIHSEIPLNDLLQSPLTSELSAIKVKIDSIFTFNNQLNSHIHIDPVAITIKNIGKINLQGINGFINMSETLSEGRLDFGAINVDAVLVKVNVNPSVYVFKNTHKISEHEFGPITSELSIPAISASGLINASMSAFKMNYDITQQGTDTFDANGQLTVSSLSMAGLPVSSITNVKQTYSLKNLSIPGMVKLQEFLRNQQEIAATTEQALRDAQLGLLTPQTNFLYHLELGTNLGNILADAKVFWPANVPVFKTADEFKQQVNVIATLEIGVPLVNQLIGVANKQISNNQLDALVTQGYLVLDPVKNEYVLILSRDVNGVKLNGKIFDPKIFVSQPAAIPQPQVMPAPIPIPVPAQ